MEAPSHSIISQCMKLFPLTKQVFVAILCEDMITSRRVYAFALAGVALWCLLILLAPLMRLAGLPTIASLLYGSFSHVCHQFGDRSFFLGAEPLGVCIRCTAVYYGFLISMLFFPFAKGFDRPAVPSRCFLALALAPMAVDVLLSFFGIHPSTAVTRLMTGLLAGATLPFYILPPLFEAFVQLRPFQGGSLHAG